MLNKCKIKQFIRECENATFRIDQLDLLYKTEEEIGITAYNRQRLEIDANAFAALIMVLSFGMVPTFPSLDLETRHMIEVRARQIMPELDD